MTRFQRALLDWYRQKGRDLPWRRTGDPYAIWVSEVMLQQTTVATALPFYGRWMDRFPTVEALAGAKDEDALLLWAGLGYYSRCRNLLAGARHVAEHGFPSTYQEWRQVRGVGPYTAAAISSIVMHEPEAVVDGNVERVFARLTACESPKPRLSAMAAEWASQRIVPTSPGNWNQAVMELGATVCRPRKPLCPECPVSFACASRSAGDPTRYPVKRPQEPVREISDKIVVPRAGSQLGIVKTPPGEWWGDMWGFPRGKLADSIDRPFALPLGTVKHTVTKHRFTVEVKLLDVDACSPEFRWLRPEEILEVPLPSPQKRALELYRRWSLASTR